jgi:hypothetical protein
VAVNSSDRYGLIVDQELLLLHFHSAHPHPARLTLHHSARRIPQREHERVQVRLEGASRRMLAIIFCLALLKVLFPGFFWYHVEMPMELDKIGFRKSCVRVLISYPEVLLNGKNLNGPLMWDSQANFPESGRQNARLHFHPYYTGLFASFFSRKHFQTEEVYTTIKRTSIMQGRPAASHREDQFWARFVKKSRLPFPLS